MKGHDEIIDLLNEVLTAELTAINQYFIHAKMCQNWGFEALYQYVRKESIDEMRHADAVITRILFLDGLPNLQRLSKLRIGQTVKEQFEADKQLEIDAIGRLNAGVAAAVRLGDNGSRELFEKILVSEEEHLDWLEAQLHLMQTVGEANYLAQQIRT
jgi:bacterioferritin